MSNARTAAILSADQLDATTPDESAQASRDRLITDADELSENLRRKIYDRAKQLGAEHADHS